MEYIEPDNALSLKYKYLKAEANNQSLKEILYYYRKKLLISDNEFIKLNNLINNFNKNITAAYWQDSNGILFVNLIYKLIKNKTN